MIDWDSALEFSYTDVLLFVLIVVFFYKVYKRETKAPPPVPKPMKKQDMTLEQLRKYNGVDDDHICLGILGLVFDVSRATHFYGPGTSYGNLAGRDATRALATMDIQNVSDEYSDHSDLTALEREEANNWFTSFKIKYPTVGRLLGPNDTPKNYEDDIADVNA